MPHTHQGSSIIPHTNQARPVPPPRRKARKKVYDPTHTTTLRKAFVREMDKRFTKLRGKIRRAIVEQDCFGLAPVRYQAGLPGYRAFAFERTSDKVGAFMDWVDAQVKADILELMPSYGTRVGQSVDNAWTNMYIQSAYQKGIERGRMEMIGAGYNVPALKDSGGLSAAFNAGQHADRAGAIYTRAYTQLKGITDAMDVQISTVLAQGLLDGKDQATIARMLVKTISGKGGDLSMTDTLGRFIPAQRRATLLARTEVIRAHHVATIQEYENWGVEGVEAEAELRTAGDANVCDECMSLEGQVYSLKESYGVIPVHPQCRCIMLPVTANSKEVDTKRAKADDEEGKRKAREMEEAEDRERAERERKAREMDAREDVREKDRKAMYEALDVHLTKAKADYAADVNYRPSTSVAEMKTQFKSLGIDDVRGFSNANSNMFPLSNRAGNAIGNDVLKQHPKLEALHARRIKEASSNRMPAFTLSPKGGLSPEHHRIGKNVGGYYQPWNNEIKILPNGMQRTAHTLYVGPVQHVDGIFRTQHNVSFDFDGIVRHEYGHYVHRGLMTATQKNKVDAIYKAIGQDRIRKELSYYGGTNPAEMWAELFSSYTSPLYDQKYAQHGLGLPDWAEKLAVDIIGPKRPPLDLAKIADDFMDNWKGVTI